MEKIPVGATRFGPFALDYSTGELLKRGRKIRLQNQPFQILAMLLERPGARPFKAVPLGVAALLLVVFSVAAWNYSRWRRPLPRSAGPGTISSVAVLPLENLTGDSAKDYLADGMTDALTTELAQVRGLRVTSRTSAVQYKKQKEPLPQIARDLGVDAVVEGTLQRVG